MMRLKSSLLFVVVFLLGIVAGFGMGNLYGANSYNAQLEQKVTDLQSRFQTVNDNYLTLVREYNKLFTLRAPSVVDVSQVSTTVTPAAPKPTTATTATVDVKVTPTPAAKQTVAPTAKPAATTAGATAPATGAKIKAEFKAEAIGGTGPLEGTPPLKVDFTDLSTGTITSWKWDFGDGETSTDKNPEHMYQDCPGDKKLCTVKLTVCGADGCVTTTKPDYIWVSTSCSGC